MISTSIHKNKSKGKARNLYKEVAKKGAAMAVWGKGRRTKNKKAHHDSYNVDTLEVKWSWPELKLRAFELLESISQVTALPK